MKTLIIKSLPTSLYQREGNYPSLAKRDEGRFFNNVILLITALVNKVLSLRIKELLPFRVDCF